VVTLSSECVTFFRIYLPELLRNTDDHSKAKALANRTFHWSDFMWHVCKPRWSDKGKQTNVMMHTACEDNTCTDSQSSSKLLLESLKNVTVNPLSSVGKCCGANTELRNTVPKNAATMTQQTIDPILLNMPDVLIGNQMLCMQHIKAQLGYLVDSTTVTSLPSFIRARVTQR